MWLVVKSGYYMVPNLGLYHLSCYFFMSYMPFCHVVFYKRSANMHHESYFFWAKIVLSIVSFDFEVNCVIFSIKFNVCAVSKSRTSSFCPGYAPRRTARLIYKCSNFYLSKKSTVLDYCFLMSLVAHTVSDLYRV